MPDETLASDFCQLPEQVAEQEHVRIVPLKHAPFLACLLYENLDRERAEQVEDGSQAGIDVVGMLLELLNADLPVGHEVRIDWELAQFEISGPSDDVLECEGDGRVILASDHPCALGRGHHLVDAVDPAFAWRRMTFLLDELLTREVCYVVAKRGSPFSADYVPVPGNIWQDFTVLDWLKGTAKAVNAETLFAIQVVFGDVETALRQLNGGSAEPQENFASLDESCTDRDVQPHLIPDPEFDQAMMELDRSPLARKVALYLAAHQADITMNRKFDQFLMREIRNQPDLQGVTKPTVLNARQLFVKARDLYGVPCFVKRLGL